MISTISYTEATAKLRRFFELVLRCELPNCAATIKLFFLVSTAKLAGFSGLFSKAVYRWLL